MIGRKTIYKALVSGTSFVAVGMCNFAIGWNLVGFFPNSILVMQNQVQTLLVGTAIFLISLVMHIISVVLKDKMQGD